MGSPGRPPASCLRSQPQQGGLLAVCPLKPLSSRRSHVVPNISCSQSLAGSSSSGNSPAGILTPLPRFCGARDCPRIAAPSRPQSPHQLRPATRAVSPCCAGRRPDGARLHRVLPSPPAVLGRPGLSSRAVTGAAALSPAGGPAPSWRLGQQVSAGATCRSFPLGVQTLRAPRPRPETPVRTEAEMAGTCAVDGRCVSTQLTC